MHFVCSAISERWMLAGAAVLMLGLSVAGCKAHVESAKNLATSTQPPVPILSDAAIKAKYQNCPSGWYSGPRPGKRWFTQDPWVWTVTPEFAKRFCMPPEFVSPELKGAEAVAFRVLRKNDAVYCGFANNPAACSGEPVIRFDVYIKSNVELPRKNTVSIYHVPDMPSAKLISRTLDEMRARGDYVKNNPEPFGYPHFNSQQVALQGVRDGVVQWPITALGEVEHRAQAYEGIDYYAFEGLSGDFQNERMLKLGLTDFRIMFEQLATKRGKAQGSKSDEYAYAIELPVFFSKKMIESDIIQGRNYSQEIRDAFRSGPVSSNITR